MSTNPHLTIDTLRTRTAGLKPHRRAVGRARLCALLLGAATWALFAGSSAQAATYTVGSPLTGPFTTDTIGAAATLTNSALPEPGARVASPVTGVVVRWRLAGASGGPFKLRVLTPDGGTTYTGAGTSSPVTTSGGATQTFATSMPISAGQVIGIDNANSTDQIGVHSVTGSAFVLFVGPLADGSTVMGVGPNPAELGFNADVVGQPGVSSISPPSGPALGGTAVTITGHDLSGATAVSFGGSPATSFTVNSDTSVTAVAPAASAGTVDVTVTSAGGQSPASASDRFTFIRPGVNSIAPSSGPRTGGTTVRITGHDLTGTTAVRFGRLAARSFAVRSDTLITAVSPATSPGSADITLTTPNGDTATAPADRFTFTQVCIVPKLTGKTLAAAKKALQRAHCRLGEARPNGQRTGKVNQQSRKPGKVLNAGSKVNVKLGQKRTRLGSGGKVIPPAI